MSFNEFNLKNQPLYPSVNVSKLNTYSVSELKKICSNCKIDIDPKTKKQEILKALFQVLT